MSKNRGLGKGISALIPDIDREVFSTKQGMVQANIDGIKTNPFQPRKIFSEQEMGDLAASIKEKGVLQPLLVKRDVTGYQLIAGERRLRAAQMTGLKTVPVIVVEARDEDLPEIALIENIQREDLNVIEEAEAYQSLIDRFNYTQEEVSKKVGKSRAVITNALRLLKLCESIRKDIAANRITMGHARAYLGLDSSVKQEEIHRIVIKKALSVRQTENIIKRIKKANLKTPTKKISHVIDKAQNEFILDELRKRFSTKVKISRKGERGKIVLEFYSNEEFDRIYDLLRGYGK